MRISDWSSDVCSSDLQQSALELMLSRADCCGVAGTYGYDRKKRAIAARVDRESVVLGKSVSVRVDLGGSRIIKKINSTHDPTLDDEPFTNALLDLVLVAIVIIVFRECTPGLS